LNVNSATVGGKSSRFQANGRQSIQDLYAMRSANRRGVDGMCGSPPRQSGGLMPSLTTTNGRSQKKQLGEPGSNAFVRRPS